MDGAFRCGAAFYGAFPMLFNKYDCKTVCIGAKSLDIFRKDGIIERKG